MKSQSLKEKLEKFILTLMEHNKNQRKDLFTDITEESDERSKGFASGMNVGCINTNSTLRAILSIVKTHKDAEDEH